MFGALAEEQDACSVLSTKGEEWGGHAAARPGRLVRKKMHHMEGNANWLVLMEL